MTQTTRDDRPTKTVGKRLSKGKSMVFLAVSLGVSLVLTEGLCRLSGIEARKIWSSIVSLDEDLGWQFCAGTQGQQKAPEFDVHWEISSHSTRVLPKAKIEGGQKGILFVGDSHNVGWGVEADQTFAHKISLASKRETHIGGCLGYSTEQSQRWAQRHGKDLDCDTVILVFYPGNDFMDNTRGRGSGGSPRPLPGKEFSFEVPDSSGPGNFLYAHSALYRLVAAVVKRIGSEVPRDQLMAEKISGAYTQYFEQAEFLRDLKSRQAALEASLAATRELVQLCEERRQRFAVIVLPFLKDDPRIPPLDPSVEKELSLPDNDVEVFRGLRDQFVEAIRGDIPCLDLGSTLSATPPPEILFYERDGHLTSAGHSWVATESLEFIQSLDKE